jgi:hypothetical protein
MITFRGTETPAQVKLRILSAEREMLESQEVRIKIIMIIYMAALMILMMLIMRLIMIAVIMMMVLFECILAQEYRQ